MIQSFLTTLSIQCGGRFVNATHIRSLTVIKRGNRLSICVLFLMENLSIWKRLIQVIITTKKEFVMFINLFRIKLVPTFIISKLQTVLVKPGLQSLIHPIMAPFFLKEISYIMKSQLSIVRPERKSSLIQQKKNGLVGCSYLMTENILRLKLQDIFIYLALIILKSLNGFINMILEV